MNGNTFTYVPNVAIPAGSIYKDLLDAALPALAQDIFTLTGMKSNPEVWHCKLAAPALIWDA